MLMTNAGKGIGYEVRMYEPYFVAEFRDEFDSESKKNSESFSALAKYIGVFGKPENELGNAMAMTSPVVQNAPDSGTAMAMTSPVVTGTTGEYMQFVLPFEFKTIESIPRPLNKKIHIKMIPHRVLAVTKFSGSYNKQVCSEKFDKLLEAAREAKLLDPSATPQWSVAQYHPPFTIPFLRRNEVWIELSEQFPEVAKLIREAEQAAENSRQ